MRIATLHYQHNLTSKIHYIHTYPFVQNKININDSFLLRTSYKREVFSFLYGIVGPCFLQNKSFQLVVFP